MCVGLVALMSLMWVPTTLPFMLLRVIRLVIAGRAHGGLIGKVLLSNRFAVFLGEISVFICLSPPESANRLQPGRQTARCAEERDRRLLIRLVELGVIVAGGALGYYVIEMLARRAITAKAQAWHNGSGVGRRGDVITPAC